MQPQYALTRESALPVRVSIYVPSQTKSGDADHEGVTKDDLLKVVLNFFTFEFGGATAAEAKGYFVHPATRQTQEESVTIVYASSTRAQISDHLETIELLANDLAVRLDQTSVAFEIGQTMYFATPTERYRQINKWLQSAPMKEKRGWSKYVDIAPLVVARNKEPSKPVPPRRKTFLGSVKPLRG